MRRHSCNAHDVALLRRIFHSTSIFTALELLHRDVCLLRPSRLAHIMGCSLGFCTGNMAGRNVGRRYDLLFERFAWFLLAKPSGS